MKQTIVYKTEKDIDNIYSVNSKGKRHALLRGIVKHQTNRRLLGLIPIPDRYVWSISVSDIVKTRNGAFAKDMNEEMLTFESRKILMSEKQDLKVLLANKCKDYKKKYGTGR